MRSEALNVELRIEPLQLTTNELGNFRITLVASNRGERIIDPELERTTLFVNGRESKAWSLAVGNGKREAKWSLLPPGESVSMTWSSLGESLFPGHGTYTLLLRHGQTELLPIEVNVSE